MRLATTTRSVISRSTLCERAIAVAITVATTTSARRVRMIGLLPHATCDECSDSKPKLRTAVYSHEHRCAKKTRNSSLQPAIPSLVFTLRLVRARLTAPQSKSGCALHHDTEKADTTPKIARRVI